MSYYELHRNKQTGDLTGAWIGTNQDGMSSDDGVFEFVFIPVVGPAYPSVELVREATLLVESIGPDDWGWDETQGLRESLTARKVDGLAYRIESNEQECASCRVTLKDDHYNDCWWLVEIKEEPA